ncbi:hypothetical protein [Pontibacter cellulosilyticus]|uniref:Uncharacterized protein n=1 Tax=Pontibacter cellulosilyticus TaxID=1720253 RepID=A0A923N6C3_9BACT|nr:hypothetical protein [Pontibacter cellulosilyticus]MBC5991310.1 hypothetical protein [Pontibacter cellulosilyticus]
MKFGLVYTYLFCFMLLVLSSCEKETLRITEHTEAWLQTKAEAKLQFTSHTGEKDEVTITVKKDTHSKANVYGDRKYEYYLLTYSGKSNDLGLVVMAEHNTINITNLGQLDFNTDFVSLTTGKNASDEVIQAFNIQAEFVDNLTLNNKTYDRVLRIVFNVDHSGTNRLKEIYYAKHHGLVYYQTTDGQFWSLDN